jgi:hypothetical protein
VSPVIGRHGYLTWPKLGLSLVTINLRWYSVQFWTVYKCTDASLVIAKMKKLAKLMNQVKLMNKVKMITLVIMSLRSVSGSLGNYSQA